MTEHQTNYEEMKVLIAEAISSLRMITETSYPLPRPNVYTYLHIAFHKLHHATDIAARIAL